MSKVVGALTGACHCGGVTVDVTALPERLTRCNCSLCTKTGAVWAYFSPTDVRVTTSTPLASYVRADMPAPCLATERCATCGCIVRWRALVPLDPPRMGVNMNLFEPDALAHLVIDQVDGRIWPL